MAEFSNIEGAQNYVSKKEKIYRGVSGVWLIFTTAMYITAIAIDDIAQRYYYKTKLAPMFYAFGAFFSAAEREAHSILYIFLAAIIQAILYASYSASSEILKS
jgi:hypothetical protein